MKIRAGVAATAMFFASSVAANEARPSDGTQPKQPPRISVFASKLHARLNEIPDNITEKNPHEVMIFFEPAPDDRHLIARYPVIPNEPPEWVAGTWAEYDFHFLVRVPETARVVVSHQGKRLIDVFTSIRYHPPPRDPMDPEVLEKRLKIAEHREKVFSDAHWRYLELLLKGRVDHWLDANCSLEENEWGYTNEWIVRELEFDLTQALHPVGFDQHSDRKAKEFFAQWQPGDRLFAYGTPRHLQTPRSGEWGYVIIRECRIVAKLMVIIS